MNKSILIRGYRKTELTEQSGSIKADTEEFFPRVFSYLKHLDAIYDGHSDSIKSLHLFSILQVLQTVLQTRKTFFYQTSEDEEYVATFAQLVV